MKIKDLVMFYKYESNNRAEHIDHPNNPNDLKKKTYIDKTLNNLHLVNVCWDKTCDCKKKP